MESVSWLSWHLHGSSLSALMSVKEHDMADITDWLELIKDIPEVLMTSHIHTINSLCLQKATWSLSNCEKCLNLTAGGPQPPQPPPSLANELWWANCGWHSLEIHQIIFTGKNEDHSEALNKHVGGLSRDPPFDNAYWNLKCQMSWTHLFPGSYCK